MNETPALPVSAAAPGAEPVRGRDYLRLRTDCRAFLAVSFGVGVLGAVCFTDAPGLGLNAVAYALGWCAAAHLSLRRLGLADAGRDGKWYAAILALAASIAWTGNGFIQFFSAAGCVLLQCFWCLNVYAPMADWDFGKAAGSVLRLALRTVRRILEPWLHLLSLRKENAGKRRAVFLGLLIALPLSALALALLSSADAAFAALLRRFFLPPSLPERFGAAVRWTLTALGLGSLFYAALCAQTDRPESAGRRQVIRLDTLIAVTFTAVLAVIYLAFCAVQLAVFLRGGAWGLPEGTTYAEYARSGFFQLLAVSAVNVLLVIVSQKRFLPGRALRALLCVISACTYFMEASSVYRMCLYVQAYGLTFLRLLVLWFLGLLAVILAGAVVTVFRPGFRLFRFSLAVCLAFWLAFAFARPDALAARYDLKRFGCGETALSLIRYELSADAIGELRPYLDTDREAIGRCMDGRLSEQIPRWVGEAGVRGFNFSLWQAGKTAEAYKNGK